MIHDRELMVVEYNYCTVIGQTNRGSNRLPEWLPDTFLSLPHFYILVHFILFICSYHLVFVYVQPDLVNYFVT